MLLLCIFPSTSHALRIEDRFRDPAMEARAVALFKELRCVVCTSESLYDSNVPLAQDIRHTVRAQMRAGQSDAAIRAFLVARYGDEVLLTPPLKPRTLPLWLFPLVMIGAGGIALIFFFHKSKRSVR